MAALTKAQRKLLERCKEDGSLIIGGIDETPNIRPAVVMRLHAAGYLKYKAPRGHYEDSQWILTEKGAELLAPPQEGSSDE